MILKNVEDEAGPDRYINANYIRVRRRVSLVTVTLQVFVRFQWKEPQVQTEERHPKWSSAALPSIVLLNLAH